MTERIVVGGFNLNKEQGLKSFGFCMDILWGSMESGSPKHLSSTEACIIVHSTAAIFALKSRFSITWKPMLSTVIASPRSSLWPTTELPTKASAWLGRYIPSSEKDQDELCRCLGAHTIYSEILSKKL